MHGEPEPSNTMTPQTHGDIAVGPTGKFQGTQKVWSLKTRNILKRRIFTDMPMPDRVILQVNTAGIKEKREQYGAYLTFKNMNNDVFSWDAEDDLSELMGDKPQVTHPDISTNLPGVLLESDHDGPTAAV